jgi:N-acetylneuraminic acid mutarotase
MAFAVRGGKIYVIGGIDNSGTITDSMFVYDPLVAVDSWSTGPPMPTARRACRAAVVNDTIYVIGGDGSADTEGYANEAYGPFPPPVYLPTVLN